MLFMLVSLFPAQYDQRVTCILLNLQRAVHYRQQAANSDRNRKKYKDDIDKQFKENEKCFVHNNCYKNYTGASNIKAAKHQANNNERVLDGKHRLRSEKTAFSNQSHCLIYTEELQVIERVNLLNMLQLAA